jgi:hypothetical protein
MIILNIGLYFLGALAIGIGILAIGILSMLIIRLFAMIFEDIKNGSL